MHNCGAPTWYTGGTPMSLVVLQQSDAVLEVGALIRTLWTKAADDGSLLKRLVRGQKMARTKGQVKRLSCKRFRVKSQSTQVSVCRRCTDYLSFCYLPMLPRLAPA